MDKTFLFICDVQEFKRESQEYITNITSIWKGYGFFFLCRLIGEKQTASSASGKINNLLKTMSNLLESTSIFTDMVTHQWIIQLGWWKYGYVSMCLNSFVRQNVGYNTEIPTRVQTRVKITFSH